MLERLGQVSHVFGRADAWHQLRAIGRRPTLFTVVVPGARLDRSVLARVRMFAAESEPLAEALARNGVPGARIRVIYPGVDLRRFAPAAPPAGRFRLLFASSPACVEEWSERGIPLLVELARAAPDVDVVLLWRDWDDAAQTSSALAALAPTPNLALDRGRVHDMSSVYASVHAIVLPFADGFGKSAPNSLLEALACGRPALLSAGVGVASVVQSAGAGLAVARSLEALLGGLAELRRRWRSYSQAARDLAVAAFDQDRFCEDYRALYAQLAAA
jgi:glycosyltransferase involved in cell wall biosynthesis